MPGDASEVKKCPLKARGSYVCWREECALWDIEANECILMSLRGLKLIGAA